MEPKKEWILAEAILDNPLLKSALRGLRYYGLLVYDTQSWKKLHCFRGVLFTLSMVLFNCTQYVDLYQVWGNVSDMTANAATTLLFTTIIFRVIFFYLNRTRFNNIIRVAHDGVERIRKSDWLEEREILDQNVGYLKRLTAVFWSCALVTANTMCVYALVEHFMYKRPPHRNEVLATIGSIMNSTASAKSAYPATILRSWYPTYDGKRNHFAEIYLIQLYIMYVGQLIVPTWHMFMVTLMVYGRAECRVLNHRLRNLCLYHAPVLPSENGAPPDRVNNPERRSLIIDCIQRQSALVAFTKELEQLTRAAVFLDFVVFSVLLCALLFEASMTTSGVQIFIDICYITTMTAILFLYYWHANEINQCADKLSESAFESDWYRYDRSTNKLLQIFIMYSNQPLKMRAFFISMSLDTFLNILRASYSYFTILKQITSQTVSIGSRVIELPPKMDCK